MAMYVMSKNLFDVNDAERDIYNNASAVVISENKLVCPFVGSGYSTRIIYKKEYPAGTYTIRATIEANTSGNNSYRVFTSAESNVGYYIANYSGWFFDVGGGLSKTFVVNEPFKIGFIFTGTYASTKTYSNIFLVEGLSLHQKVKMFMRGKNLFDIDNINVAFLPDYANKSYMPKVIDGVLQSGGRWRYSRGGFVYISTKNMNRLSISLSASWEETETTRILEVWGFDEVDENGIAVNATMFAGFNLSEKFRISYDVSAYSYIGFCVYSNNQYGCHMSNIQFEEGTTATDYEPFKIVKKSIQI